MIDEKILIAEDSTFLKEMIKSTLVKAGFKNLYDASDGIEAVESYKKNHPDIVLMDANMPNKNGVEALMEIKTIDPNANVIMLLTLGQEALPIESIKLGAKDFIVKPFRPQSVLNAVKRLIG